MRNIGKLDSSLENIPNTMTESLNNADDLNKTVSFLKTSNFTVAGRSTNFSTKQQSTYKNTQSMLDRPKSCGLQSIFNKNNGGTQAVNIIELGNSTSEVDHTLGTTIQRSDSPELKDYGDNTLMSSHLSSNKEKRDQDQDKMIRIDNMIHKLDENNHKPPSRDTTNQSSINHEKFQRLKTMASKPNYKN